MRQFQFLLDLRRLPPILIGSVAGILILFSRLFPNNQLLQGPSTIVLEWVGVLAAFAIITGVLNVAWMHLRRLKVQNKRWPYSVALLVGLIIPPSIALYSSLVQQQRVLGSPIFQNIIQWVYTPLAVSLLALLTFFAITAAVRALGSGNREAVVLIIVAGIVMFLQLPVVASFPMVGDTVAWIQRYLAMAGLRGLALGAAIGAVVASVRVLIGLDRPYLDR